FIVLAGHERRPGASGVFKRSRVLPLSLRVLQNDFLQKRADARPLAHALERLMVVMANWAISVWGKARQIQGMPVTGETAGHMKQCIRIVCPGVRSDALKVVVPFWQGFHRNQFE